MSIIRNNYSCEVRQSLINHTHQNHADDHINPASTSTSTERLFLIDVFVTRHVIFDDDDHDQDQLLISTISSSASSSSSYYQFMAQKHHLLDNSAMSWSMISNMLSHMHVPFHAQPFLIHKISTSARDIAARQANASSHTIRLVVSLVAGPKRWGHSDDAGLGIRVGHEKNSNDFCVICLGEILGLGCEVIVRLPCSHVYHEECILCWFEKSNLCPLCRFEMPLDCDNQ